MAQQFEVCDVAGAVRVYCNTYPGLTGAGNPLASGVHLGRVRSPAKGAVASLRVLTPRELTDISDDARVSFAVTAVGSERGARETAEYAARALARALLQLANDGPVDVTTRRGETVRLLVAGDVAGPSEGGDLGGEFTMLVDATVRCQDRTGAFGAGPFGDGPFGG